MNKKRREQLNGAKALMERASFVLDAVQDEEKDALDNYPENLQSTDAYYKIEDAVDALGDAISSLSDAIHYVEQAAE